ncbi:MAG: DNA methyltransferase [Gammaproteobacteria bacterium]|nr:DNA methyltransferase [Gammaproteobacteria bacterium]
MNSESVDLIATDPPFNKGRDFHATPDSLAAGAKFQDRWSWERDVHEEWTDQIKDDYPRLMEAIESARYAHSDGMGAYMCFMAVRLLAMRRVLKPTGSIYLHCDPTASHYLKAVMDAIFGWKNFRNEIIWCYKSGGASPKKYFSKKHDLILWFSKSKDYVFNAQKEKSYNRGLKPYRFKGVEEYQDEIGWHTLVGMKDYWQIDMVGRTSKERSGFPTQKPLALYERIIKASSKEGDMVLDPFAGCATTCVAAQILRRQWVGIDIWDKAHEVVVQRLRDRTGLFGEVTFTDQLPERTDDGDTAAPFLRVKERVKEPEGPRWTRAQMYEYLLTQHGPRCMGCDRAFDDSRYLELDHNTPRADGGLNHISNRILLCGPCNKLKSNIYTLSGLIRENRKRGYMAK